MLEQLQIETTAFCNAKCLMCPQPKMMREKRVMKGSLFNKIIQDCKDVHSLKVILPFLNGEPFMDPHILDRIKYINEVLPNVQVWLHTNASLLTENKILELLKLNVNFINVSFEGGCKETYEKVMGLNFSRTFDNVKYLLTHNHNTRIKIQMLLFDETKNDVEKFKQLWDGYNCEISICPIYNWGGDIKGVREPSKVPCYKILHDMCIFWNGDVPTCCMDNEGVNIMGNISRTPILDVWRSKLFEGLRSTHYKRQRDNIPICGKCDIDIQEERNYERPTGS